MFAAAWDKTGRRHDLALALAGCLLTKGLDGTEVEAIIRTAATIADDDEVEDRARAARETADKHERGEKKLQGAGQLRKLVDAQIVDQLLRWFDPDARPVSRLRKLADVPPENVEWLCIPTFRSAK
jgi:hypothetical protein